MKPARMKRGFTLIELLVVIGIITLLMAAMFSAVGKIRQRTQIGQIKNLLEKVHNALENYHLHFRTYPPDSYGGKTESQALNYFLSTGFRNTAPLKTGEVLASVNVGPLAVFEDRDLGAPVAGDGTKSIVDPWQKALRYKLDVRDFPDPLDATKITKIPIPVLYSLGVNKIDDTAANNIPSDDIFVGKK